MKWLTKSVYMKFLIHPAYLWLGKYTNDALPEFDEEGFWLQIYDITRYNEVYGNIS